MNQPRWLAELLATAPQLAAPIAQLRKAAQVLREVTAQAFVSPPEPSHPYGQRLAEGLEKLRQRAQELAGQPSPETALQLLQELEILHGESFFLAPTRATSGPVARWALAQALQRFQEAFRQVEAACGQASLPVPWRLVLASHVDESLPAQQMSLVGNELPGLPASSLPWGERCALSGAWYQRDGDGRLRFRAEESFFTLHPQAQEVFALCQQALGRLAEGHPQLAAAIEAAFPQLGQSFYPDTSGTTFSCLLLREFPSLAVSLHNALVRYAPRTAFFRAWDGARLTYGQLHLQVLALAQALEATGLPSGAVVALAFGKPGWEPYLLDFACLFSDLASLIVDPSSSPEGLQEILSLAGAAAVIGDGPGLERLGKVGIPPFALEALPGVEPLSLSPPRESFRTRCGLGLRTPLLFADEPSWEEAERAGIASDGPEKLYTLVFTSGSTGQPKGVGITCQRMRAGMEYQAFLYPFVVASFQPPSLLADRKLVWQALFNGGRVGFCRRGPELWQDIARVAPTYLEGPPAFFQPLLGPYQRALEQGASARELARLRLAFRERLGGRVAAVAVGGAAVPPELPSLLQACLQAPVREAYGATEVGTLAEGGKLRPGLQVRLVDHPELGFTSQDQPYPRGELAVKLPENRSPYWVASAQDQSRVTADGYFLTGDLVELRPGGEVRVLGRVSAASKLADGRFVVAEELEAAALASGLCQGAALLPSSRGPVLMVVAQGDQRQEELREALSRFLARRFPGRALPPVLVDDTGIPWTAEAGLLTPSLKPRRAALARHYQKLLEKAALLPPPELSRQDLLPTLASLLHRKPEELDLQAPLASQGLDSLGMAEILALADARGLPLSAENLRQWTLHQLLEAWQGTQEESPQPAEQPPLLLAQSSEDQMQLEVLRVKLPKAVPAFSPQGFTLLSGATGFLGVHLAASLASNPPAGGPLVALVRAKSHPQAAQRLREAASRAGVALPPVGLPGDQGASLWAVACQLAEPFLGLSQDLYALLAQKAAVIVHAAASVRHGASFSQLVEDNVKPTRHLLALAVEGRGKAFHFISTLDVTRLALGLSAGEGEEAPLPSRLGEAVASLDGYVASKWVAERMVELLYQHCQGQLPVLVSRPGLLAWAQDTGYAPLKEWFPALLASCLQLGVLPKAQPAVFPSEPVLTETSARGLEFLPVDFAAQLLARLTLALVGSVQRGGPSFFRLNLVNTNPGTAGLALWPQIFSWLQAAYLAENHPAKPLAAVSWRDFRDLCLAGQAPFAPLVASFPQLPAVPRLRAEMMKGFCQQEPPPALSWPLFRPFVRFVGQTHPQEGP